MNQQLTNSMKEETLNIKSLKKILFLLIFVLAVTTVVGQNEQKKDNPPRKQSELTDVYELFPTQNTWTFIKLNTRNGKLWQVQFSIKGNRMVTELNSTPLVLNEMEINGRFTLYPTDNIYNFILLDQVEGDTWQVQWSAENELRAIFPIK
jgi:hypothetical protein